MSCSHLSLSLSLPLFKFISRFYDVIILWVVSTSLIHSHLSHSFPPLSFVSTFHIYFPVLRCHNILGVFCLECVWISCHLAFTNFTHENWDSFFYNWGALPRKSHSFIYLYLVKESENEKEEQPAFAFSNKGGRVSISLSPSFTLSFVCKFFQFSRSRCGSSLVAC